MCLYLWLFPLASAPSLTWQGVRFLSVAHIRNRRWMRQLFRQIIFRDDYLQLNYCCLFCSHWCSCQKFIWSDYIPCHLCVFITGTCRLMNRIHSEHLVASTTWGGICPLQKADIYTGCPRRKGPNFGRVFLRSNYTDITQNTYIQSSMVTEIQAREVWNFNSYYSLIDYQIHIETGRNMWFL